MWFRSVIDIACSLAMLIVNDGRSFSRRRRGARGARVPCPVSVVSTGLVGGRSTISESLSPISRRFREAWSVLAPSRAAARRPARSVHPLREAVPLQASRRRKVQVFGRGRASSFLAALVLAAFGFGNSWHKSDSIFSASRRQTGLCAEAPV